MNSPVKFWSIWKWDEERDQRVTMLNKAKVYVWQGARDNLIATAFLICKKADFSRRPVDGS